MLGFHINTVSEWVDNFRWMSHWVLQPVRLFLGIICLPHCPAALLALVPVLEYQACFSPFPCSGHLHDSIIPAPSLYSPIQCAWLFRTPACFWYCFTCSLIQEIQQSAVSLSFCVRVTHCDILFYLPFLSSWQWFLLFALYSGDQLLS